MEFGLGRTFVFARQRRAVFVDGCFWHRCVIHGTTPETNAVYWRTKLAGNVARDEIVNDSLTRAGWEVVRIWEHASVEEALVIVESQLLPGSSSV